MTRRISPSAHLAQELFPLLARQTLIVPICPRMLAAMIEEPLIVVLRLQRLDFLVDEVVKHGQIVGDLPRDGEIHYASP